MAAQWALTLNGSTICDNTADGIGGGVLDAFPRLQLPGQDAPQGGDFSITNSTITRNRATLGSAFAGDYSVPIVNSTIAFNTSTLGGAVAILDTWPLEKTMNLDSTIIANNAIDGPGGHAADITASSEITLTVLGANNLVGLVDPNVTLPADTLRSDPLLLPLADNGGPTWTMALAAGSPALDAGANPLDLASDQRGDGYVRESGAAADIGAYEAQIADAIFIDGFEP